MCSTRVLTFATASIISLSTRAASRPFYSAWPGVRISNLSKTGLRFLMGECPVTQKGCKLETLYGNLWTPDWPDDLILRSLQQLGEWGALEAILASRLLDVGEVLWDAGAFLGTFALGVAKEKQPGQVIAIEANPELAPYLTENLQILPCMSTVLSLGLGRSAGLLVSDGEHQDNHGATTYTFREDASDGNHDAAIACKA